jgi:hypothetical protein
MVALSGNEAAMRNLLGIGYQLSAIGHQLSALS